LKNDARSIKTTELSYTIPVAVGPVWCIKFYPIENPEDFEVNIGVLAVTTSSGEVHIYSLPMLSNQCAILNLEATYRLRLSEDPPSDSLKQPCKLSWSKGKCGDTYLGVGYRNGFVAIWDFQRLSNAEIQYPFHVIAAHPTSITALDFHCTSKVYLMTCSLDRRIKVFSLSNSIPTEISNFNHKTRVMCGEFWLHWATLMTGNDESFCKGCSNTMKQPHEIFKASSLVCNDHSISSLSLNHYLNVALFASDNGDLVTYRLQQMAYFGGKQKNFSSTRSVNALSYFIENYCMI
jgi:WD40 repeat protein